MDRAGVWMVGGDVAARDPLGEIVVKLDAHSYGLKKMTTKVFKHLPGRLTVAPRDV